MPSKAYSNASLTDVVILFGVPFVRPPVFFTPGLLPRPIIYFHLL